MIFLLGVVLSAVMFGIWPAVYASVLSFFAYNFFFITPLYTFTIAEPFELFALVIFLAVAIMTSALAGRARDQARIASERARAMRRLYEFTRGLSGLARADEIARAAAAEMHASFGGPAVVFLAERTALALRAVAPPEHKLDDDAIIAAQWAFAHNEPTGANAQIMPAIAWLFVPLTNPRHAIGVVGIAVQEDSAIMNREARAVLDTLVEQIAAALERAALDQEMVSARNAAETERVRNTLLASISHDFRTPLSSILGSATTLLEYRDKLDSAAQKDLLGQIKQEAEHLNDMVRNLLAMVRIDAGALELRTDWIDLRETTERVVNLVRRRGATQKLETMLGADLPLIRADATLVEQVLGNVLANAIAYTSASAKVLLDTAVGRNHVALRVTDDGPGIPKASLPHVFEKFMRVNASGAARSDGGEGTGLGLAIAKGIMEAHGGSITAESPIANGRGTRIVLTFPRRDAS
jgi:two-component system sensor histidine kinase KdpD